MQHTESRNGEKRAQILIMPALKKMAFTWNVWQNILWNEPTDSCIGPKKKKGKGDLKDSLTN